MDTQTKRLLELATAAHARGEAAAARQLYGRVLEVDPGNSIANGNLGVLAAQQGNTEQAEKLFRAAIAADPNYAEAYNNLGLLQQQRGRPAEAIEAFRRATGIKPRFAAALLNLANALKQQGETEQAVGYYRLAIAARPHYPEAYSNLGAALQHLGRGREAEAAYRRAIALAPNSAAALFNLGGLLHEVGRLDDALAIYQRLVALAPDWAEARNNLGVALRDKGIIDDALAALRAAVALKPDYAEAHYNLGVTLQHAGRLEQAGAAYGRALTLRPDYAEAHNNSGLVLRAQGALPQACEALRAAIALRPEFVEARNNLGAVLHDLGRRTDAIAALEAALALAPEYPAAHFNLGNALRDEGRLAEGIAAYARACELNRSDAAAFSQLLLQRWRACEWTGYAPDQARLREMVRGGCAGISPFVLLAASASPAELLACAGNWVAPLLKIANPFQHERAGRGTPIRLGYLSCDFHQHATASLAVELFERHDRARFEVSAYSFGPDDGSEIRQRLQSAFARFIDITALTHRQAAERIHADGIDILIDLKGHTYNARPAILAHRPAPICVSYLGFPGTTGAKFVDYLIADRFVVPPADQAYYAEQVVYLPHCYQPNDTQRRIAALASSRTKCGLPASGFVFCCFNNSFKLTPTLFDVWMRLLRAVPDSVLWLLEGNALMSHNLRREAASRAVDPSRLIFAPILPPAQHLARHVHADLFLDTLPCNAHTTMSDALWAGLPALTVSGETFAGRVGASLLAAAGLPELIATSLADYEQRARRLAERPQDLQRLRGGLTRNRAALPLFDIGQLTRSIEAAYAQMADRWQAGLQPVAITV